MDYNSTILNLPRNRVRNNPRLSTIGKLFIAVLLVVIFEGAVRKWISSAFTNPLVLLRDAMALYGIFWAIKTNRLKLTKIGTQILWLWTAVVVVWGLLQLIVNQSSPFIFIIGARFWLLYLWFAYAAAVSLTEHDFSVISKTILLLLLVMTPLAIAQHFLPPGVFINKQVDGDGSSVFLVTADIVRTTGTFSFTLGYTVFLGLATPFVLAVLAPEVKLWKRKWMPKACLLALGIATLVSGSRGAVIFLGLLFSVYALASLVYSKGSKKGSALIVVVIIAMMLASVAFVFSRAVDATEERFEAAAQSENFSSRLVSMFFGEPGVYKGLPLLGHGIGVGTNFAGTVATGERTFLLAETEAARTILEGGLLGFAFIGLKLLVIAIGLRKSLFIVKSTGNSLPLMLWITTSLALLSWSIIGQLTVNALGYLLFGLFIASLRLNSRSRA
ncbi:hypothetical protein ACVBEF_13425 [Glaciimonas sp. GG7]